VLRLRKTTLRSGAPTVSTIYPVLQRNSLIRALAQRLPALARPVASAPVALPDGLFTEGVVDRPVATYTTSWHAPCKHNRSASRSRCKVDVPNISWLVFARL